MSKYLPISFFFMLQTLTGNLFSQVNMFRGTPDHQNACQTKKDFVFAEQAWEFSTEAPVRSSVVFNDNTIFFGASNGILYALDKTSGTEKWRFKTGYAIASSPAYLNGNVFFSDNKQSLYSLNAKTGTQNWKLNFGISREYEWAFDYFYSSPTITGNNILIGTKDGFLYNVDATNGIVVWKFQTQGIVRSTPAISSGIAYFGDTEGILYALKISDQTEIWRFKTTGNGLKNEDFGFDRRAIISSPVVAGNKIIVGGRDGFLYAVDKNTGIELWRVDHKVSWVISSVAVKDSFVVTGTSDGRFVQAVNLNTGKEIWKFNTISIVWSSPVIYNNKVYIGSQEGVLYCLDLLTGKKINSFQGKGKIFTSPVISNSLLYFGTDKGMLYALQPIKNTQIVAKNIKRYVFWEAGVNTYFHLGTDVVVKEYLAAHHYNVIDGKKLSAILRLTDSSTNSVIVFAANYFPNEIIEGNQNCLVRKYLDNGGRIVVLGMNPVIYKTDSLKNLTGFNFLKADSVLGIKYKYNDLRSMGGVQPAFRTKEGEEWGLQKFWTGFLPLQKNQVDIVLGIDENNMVSAWIKRFTIAKGSGFIQVWYDTDGIEEPDGIIKIAEHDME